MQPARQQQRRRSSTFALGLRCSGLQGSQLGVVLYTLRGVFTTFHLRSLAMLPSALTSSAQGGPVSALAAC